MRAGTIEYQEKVIVRQQRRKARVRRSMEEALDCTDPKLTISRVRGWISDLS